MPTVIESPNTNAVRLVFAVHAARLYLASDGKMRMTRTATPARLREIIGSFTGKKYPRSRQGLTLAYVHGRDLLAQNGVGNWPTLSAQ